MAKDKTDIEAEDKAEAEIENKDEAATDNKPVKEDKAATEKESEKEPVKKKGGGLIKLIIVIVIIAAVVVVAYVTGAISYLDPNSEVNLIGIMDDWVAELGNLQFIAWIVYILLYAVAAVFFLPALIFAILAGVVFKFGDGSSFFAPALGGILALLGGTVGAIAAFIVARYVARKSIVNKFGNSSLFKKIDEGIRVNGVSFLILTRLVPVFPYNVQNYIYGLTPIKLGTYALVSLITMAPGAFLYAFMAGTIARQGLSIEVLLAFVAAGVILFLISLIPKFIAKKKGIKLKDD